MSKTGRRRKERKAEVAPLKMPLLPTIEREAHNKTEPAGPAKRMMSVLDSLFETQKLTERQYTNLAYYRMQGNQAEDDQQNESTLSPERIMGGGCGSTSTGGLPKGMAFSYAALETGRIERDLGTLRDIARAICVDNMTLSKWCVERFGGRERYDGKGKFVAIVPICEKRHMANAMLELKHAAGRITLDTRR